MKLTKDMVQWQSREHGNKPSGSIKSGEFFDQLSDFPLLNKDLIFGTF
jgi:hypothetical protein